jgi:cell division protein FtsX
MKTKLQKNIMRRVYYSYAVSFITESMLWQGFVLGACIALFGRLTHVAAIAHNFGATKLENAPSFVWNSVAHALWGGEVLTVLVVLFMVGLTVSFLYRAVQTLTFISRAQNYQVG